jgi:hypothetical protein
LTWKKSPFIWTTALFIITTIVAAYSAAYYYNQAQIYMGNYEKLSRDLNGLTMKVNVKLDFGNNTVRWFNDTRAPLNSTVLTATRLTIPTEYSTSQLGAFVTKISGVSGDARHYWGWSYWDTAKNSWVMGSVGSDAWVVHDGDIISWTYSTF